MWWWCVVCAVLTDVMVMTGGTAVPISIYLIVLTRLLFNRNPDHTAIRKRWLVACLAIFVVGTLLLVVSGLGKPATYLPNNPLLSHHNAVGLTNTTMTCDP